MSENFRQNMPFFKYLSKNFVNRISLFIIFRVSSSSARVCLSANRFGDMWGRDRSRLLLVFGIQLRGCPAQLNSKNKQQPGHTCSHYEVFFLFSYCLYSPNFGSVHQTSRRNIAVL